MTPPPFQQVLDAHGRRLARYLAASVGPEAVEDCFQDTVVAALAGYDRVDADRDLSAWLFTIAHGVVVDHHRRRTTRSRAYPAEPRPAPEVPPPGEPALWSALAALPPKQRSATVLRVLEDLPYRTIGELLDCSEAAARRNVHVALTKLREELAHA